MSDHVNNINRSAGVALFLIAVLPVAICFVMAPFLQCWHCQPLADLGISEAAQLGLDVILSQKNRDLPRGSW